MRILRLTTFGGLPYSIGCMKNYTLSLLLTTAPLFAGVPAPMMAPAPQCDCPQGWTLGLEVLGLRPYQSEGGYDESDLDVGFRGSVGYEFGDCLFVKLTGFGYETDVLDVTETTGGEFPTSFRAHGDLEVSYFDLVVGQHFTQCDKLTLSPYVGLRWANFEESFSESESFTGGPAFVDNANVDFSGLGIVVGIDATRSFGNNFSIYGTAKQSVVFGEADVTNDFDEVDPFTDDRVVFISEFGLGVQYDFSFSSVAANVRLGVEGQWWAGPSGFGGGSSGDSENVGLAGFVLGANFRF